MEDIKILPKTVYSYKGVEHTSLVKIKRLKLDDDMRDLMKTFENIWNGITIIKSEFDDAHYLERINIAIEKAKKIRAWLLDNIENTK